MLEATPAEKANYMVAALGELRAEYKGRPDIRHAIDAFLQSTGPAQHALLFDLVKRYPTKEQALAKLGVKAHG